MMGSFFIGVMIYLGLYLVARAITSAGIKLAERPVVVTHEHHIYALSKNGWVKFNPQDNSWSTVTNPTFKLVEME